MIYYPLSTLMLAGIKEIAIISDSKNLRLYKKLLGNGEFFGISITYLIQNMPPELPKHLQLERILLMVIQVF